MALTGDEREIDKVRKENLIIKNSVLKKKELQITFAERKKFPIEKIKYKKALSNVKFKNKCKIAKIYSNFKSIKNILQKA